LLGSCLCRHLRQPGQPAGEDEGAHQNAFGFRPAVKMPRKPLIVIALAAISFIFYANALNGEFITDDIQTILRNPAISQIQRFWLDPAAFLNSFNYLLAANNPWGYHLTNIILHAINSALAFFFLAIFFSDEAAFLGACIFAVHPIHTEAVSWVSGRSYLISALFMLGGYLLYHYSFSPGRAANRKNAAMYFICLAAFSYFMIGRLLTLYLLFPAVIIFSDFTFGRWRQRLWRWLPFLLAPLLISCALKQGAQASRYVSERVGYMVDKSGYLIAANPLTYFAYSFYSHLRLLLWPDKLTLFHEPLFMPDSMMDCRVLFYIAPIIFLLFLAWRKSRALFFALCLFIILLAPTYSPIPFASLLAERYLYFPSLSLSMLFAFGYDKISLCSRRSRAIAEYLFIFLLAAYGLRTIARNYDWGTAHRFWLQAKAVSPKNAIVRENLGFVYLSEGNFPEAIAEFQQVLALKGPCAGAKLYHNLGVAYGGLGKTGQAIDSFRMAIKLDPSSVSSYINLGRVYFANGDTAKSIALLRRALEIDPGSELANSTLREFRRQNL
jgi:Flp pilus assembly protein TadD